MLTFWPYFLHAWSSCLLGERKSCSGKPIAAERPTTPAFPSCLCYLRECLGPRPKAALPLISLARKPLESIISLKHYLFFWIMKPRILFHASIENACCQAFVPKQLTCLHPFYCLVSPPCCTIMVHRSNPLIPWLAFHLLVFLFHLSILCNKKKIGRFYEYPHP